MIRKTRYRFAGRVGDHYYWISQTPVHPNDPRHEQIRCPVDWFWSRP